MRQRLLQASQAIFDSIWANRNVRRPSGKYNLAIVALLAYFAGNWGGRRTSGAPLEALGNSDPFAEEGSLFLNLEDPYETNYKPFDSSRPSSHLSPVIRSILDSNAIDTQKALPWLVNTTVVLIGDSIERFSLDYFCEMFQGELSIIDMEHPWSPKGFRNGRDELHEDAEVMKMWTADGRPHRCHLNRGGLNMNLFSFFMYGSATYDEYVVQDKVFKRPHYFAPAQLDDRIDHWVMGVLEKAGLQATLVEFSSCLWDIMHLSEVDAAAAGTEDAVHSPFSTFEPLDWYQARLTASLDKVESTWPDIPLVWRRGHAVLCGQFHVPCARNAQFNGMADYILPRRKRRWIYDEFGSVISGHFEFFKDKVHPGEAFRGLWSDILFYHLREAYYERVGRPKWNFF